MKTDLIRNLTETFEAHAQETENGVEFWLARDVQHLLGYAEWRNFIAVVNKAKTACEVSEQAITDHFVNVDKMVEIGSGGQREVDDIMLTRYACYLIAQTGGSKNFGIIRTKGDKALFAKTTKAMKSKISVFGVC